MRNKNFHSDNTLKLFTLRHNEGELPHAVYLRVKYHVATNLDGQFHKNLLSENFKKIENISKKDNILF